MMLRNKPHLIGLDIGSRSIKAAEIFPAKSGFSLKKFGMVALPPGAIEEGAIQDPDAVVGAVQKLITDNKFKNKNVATSIGGYSVIVKKINVQNMPEEQLQDTIAFEAEQYIPFDINDVNLDFQILGENENNPNQMNVLLVAARRDMIDEYVNVIDLAGLNPCIVDVDAFALQNCYEANLPGEEGVNVALIDIGAGKTSLNILKDNTSEFIRDVSMGCDQINTQIMSAFNCTFEDSETLKFGKAPDNRSAEEVADIIHSVVTEWSREVRRVFDFYYASFPENPIDRILISGGGANVRAFQKLMAEESQTRVEPLNPFINVRVGSVPGGKDALNRIAPQAAICLGLALRRMDDK
jgi:type IV pilus assembly protein PilM